MNTLNSRTFNLALRAWVDGDESGRNAERVAAFVIEKALSGHFAYFKLVIDLVDGKIRQTNEEECTFEADCALVDIDKGLESKELPRTERAA